MAQLNGVEGGLLAMPEPPAPKVRVRKPTIEKRCSSCDGLIPRGKAHFDPDEATEVCRYCSTFFGMNSPWPNTYGYTKGSPTEAKERIAELRESGFAMILKDNTLAFPEGGNITLEMGDVFKLADAKPAPAGENEYASQQLTWRLFTIRIQASNREIVQFPHEVSPVTWLYIMNRRADGELMEQYLGANDEIGYFGPPPAIREEIKATFGNFWRT